MHHQYTWCPLKPERVSVSDPPPLDLEIFVSHHMSPGKTNTDPLKNHLGILIIESTLCVYCVNVCLCRRISMCVAWCEFSAGTGQKRCQVL